MNKKSYLRGFGTGVLFTAIVLGSIFLVKQSDSHVVDRAIELGMVFPDASGSKGVSGAVSRSAITGGSSDTSSEAKSDASSEAGSKASDDDGKNDAGGKDDTSGKTAENDDSDAAENDDASVKADDKGTANDKSTTAADKSTTADKSTKTSDKSTKSASDKNSSRKEDTVDKKFETERSNMEKNVKKAEVSLTITDGMYGNDVAKSLASLGVIKDAGDFSDYMYRNGYENKIRSGTYKIDPDATFRQIAEEITHS
jgi:hypothetical protein